jgi:Major Facilitator Superfamily
MARPFPPVTRHSTIQHIQQDPGSIELRSIPQDFIDKDPIDFEIHTREIMSSVDITTPPAGDQEKIISDEPTPRKKNIFAGKSSRFWLAFVMLVLTAFISALDAVIIAAALPAITTELKGSSNQAFWSGTAFLLASTITQPLFGTFSEIFGRKVNLMFALVWFLVGSILCARSTGMEMFIGSRVVCARSGKDLIIGTRYWRRRNDRVSRGYGY